MRPRTFLFVIAIAISTACGGSGDECTFNSQCAAGYFCSARMCVAGECDSDDECVATHGESATCSPFGVCVGGSDAGPRVDGGSAIDAGLVGDGGNVDAADGDASLDAAVDDASVSGDDAGTLFDPSIGAAQIIAIRAATPGAIAPALPLDGAVVTYVRPLIGGDPAGFFVQAAATGPALFVAIDPATLTPALAVGDVVAFEVAETAVALGQHRVTALAPASLVRLGAGASIAPFVQDVSSADVVATLDELESELVRIDLTLTGEPVTCGSPHVCVQATSIGVPTASTMLRLRTTADLVATHALRSGCAIRAGPTPMGRFSAEAQPSAWVASEISVVSCPALRLLSATVTSATTVTLGFDAPLDPATVPASAFALSDGATVTGALATASSVALTTSPLVPGTTYTVTVAPSARDAGGTAIDAAARSATFTFVTGSASGLVINEVDYDSVGADTAEFVEIFNPTSAAVPLAGHSLVLVNGTNGTTYATIDLSGAGSLPAGGFLVVANATVSVAPGALVRPWPGAQDQIQNGAPDGIALVAGGTLVDVLSYEGAMTSVSVTGVSGTVSLVEGTATSVADNNASAASLVRVPNGRDTDDAGADWMLSTTPSPGAPN